MVDKNLDISVELKLLYELASSKRISLDLSDCNFYESYGVYPWSKSISKDGDFSDNGWLRNVLSDIEYSWDRKDFERIKLEVTTKESLPPLHDINTITSEFIEFHASGFNFLDENSYNYFLSLWLWVLYQDGYDLLRVSCNKVFRTMEKLISMGEIVSDENYCRLLVKVFSTLNSNEREKCGFEISEELKRMEQLLLSKF